MAFSRPTTPLLIELHNPEMPGALFFGYNDWLNLFLC
jgi:hypothetical protein